MVLLNNPTANPSYVELLLIPMLIGYEACEVPAFKVLVRAACFKSQNFKVPSAEPEIKSLESYVTSRQVTIP